MNDQPIPVMVETFTGAAIDAARISVSTAQILVSLDRGLDEPTRVRLLDHLQEGLTWLHAARELMPVERPTSIHVAPASGIIIPP